MSHQISHTNVLSKQGKGKQCQTPGVKFKELTGIHRENGMKL